MSDSFDGARFADDVQRFITDRLNDQYDVDCAVRIEVNVFLIDSKRGELNGPTNPFIGN